MTYPAFILDPHSGQRAPDASPARSYPHLPHRPRGDHRSRTRPAQILIVAPPMGSAAAHNATEPPCSRGSSDRHETGEPQPKDGVSYVRKQYQPEMWR